MRKVSTYTGKVNEKKEREFQIPLTNNSSSSRVDDKSTNFLEDELDGESIEVFDLY